MRRPGLCGVEAAGSGKGRRSSPHNRDASGMVLFEQDDEWQDGRRYFSAESMAVLEARTGEEVSPALLMAS